MYKKLSREEERMIRKGQESSPTNTRKWAILRGLIFFAMVFVIFTVIAYLVFVSGKEASGR